MSWKRRRGFILYTWVLFITIYLFAAVSAETTTRKPKTTATIATPVIPTNSTVRLSSVNTTEVEIWNGTSWIPAGGSPQHVDLPAEGSKWSSKWTTMDGEWEYVLTRPHQAIRQRTWTRSYEVKIKKPKKRKKKASEQVETYVGPTITVPGWMQAIRNDWNFKGFGFTFYKSLFYLKSAGVALRLPLTYNLGLFEKNPALPAVSWTLAIYYPWTIAVFMNVSFRLEFLKWLSRRAVERCIGTVLWIFWFSTARSLSILLAAMLFPVTGRWPEFSAAPLPIGTLLDGGPNDKPEYSRTTEERLGWSASWRVSQERGYEYRNSVWHFLAPTFTSTWQRIPLLKNRDPPDWFRRRLAAYGTSISGPIPDSPHIGGSAIVTLSGYQFRDKTGGT